MVWHLKLNPDKIEGEKDGFKYKFVQVLPNSKLMFILTSPDGDSHWVEVCSKRDVDLLTESPAEFYKKYFLK